MANPEKIIAPLSGKVKPITAVNDEVFSTKLLGDGVAIEPIIATNVIIVSPVSGTVQSTHDSKHAIGIFSNHGNEVLLHVGVDTVNLKGEGFKQFVKEGDKVNAGDKLLEVNFEYISKNAPSSDVIVIVTNLEDNKTIDAHLGEVKAKELIISIK